MHGEKVGWIACFLLPDAPFHLVFGAVVGLPVMFTSLVPGWRGISGLRSFVPWVLACKDRYQIIENALWELRLFAGR